MSVKRTLTLRSHQSIARTGLVALVFLVGLIVPSVASSDGFVFNALSFRDASFGEVIRQLSAESGTNFVISDDARNKKVTASIKSVGVENALNTLCKLAGLSYRKDSGSGIYRVMTKVEYDEDIAAYPNHEMRIFPLQHYNVTSAAYAIKSLFGPRVHLQLDQQPDETGLGTQNLIGDHFRGNPAAGRNPTVLRQQAAIGSLGTGDWKNAQHGETDADIPNQGSRAPIGSLLNGQINPDASPHRYSNTNKSSYGLGQIPHSPDVGSLDPLIYVTTSRLHNLVMVRTSDKDKGTLQEIEAFLKDIDISARQVLLELEILELTAGDGFNWSIDADFTSSTSAEGPESDAPRNPLSPDSSSSSPVASLGLGNFPLALDPGTLLFQWMNDNIRLRIQALKTENKISVLARPVLLASNNTPSRLFIGERRVFTTGVTTSTSLGSTGTSVNLISADTELMDIGNELVILPRVNEDGTVTLTIRQNTSSVLVDGAVIPVSGVDGVVTPFPVDSIISSSVEGTFLAADGLTVAIGGMIRRSSAISVSKIPILGDLPLIGLLFRSTETQHNENELVLLITPHLHVASDATDLDRRLIDRISDFEAQEESPWWAWWE